MLIRSDFPQKYRIQQTPELPGRAGQIKVFYYPGASQTAGHDGVLVKVWPEVEKPWIGCFAFGYKSSLAISAISACPNPDDLCVIASGAGYTVRADSPLQWQQLPCFPIVEFLAIVERRLLVFGDFIKLIAYGQDGVKWISPQLSSDGLKIVGVDGNHLQLTAWKAELRSEVAAYVDLETGSVF